MRKALLSALLAGTLFLPTTAFAVPPASAALPEVQQLSTTVPVYDPMAGIAMGITGLFERTVPGTDGRTAKIYVPEGAVLGTAMVVLTVPDGEETVEWLVASDWIALADEKDFLLYVLEPGATGDWGSIEAEQSYIDTAYASISVSTPDGRGTWYLPPESYYVVGYDRAGTALHKAVMKDPTLVAAAAFVDASDIDADYLTSMATTFYPTPDEDGDPVAAASVPLPVWILSREPSAATTAVIDHWRTADHTESRGVTFRDGRLYRQAAGTLDGFVADSSRVSVAVSEGPNVRAAALSGSRALYDGFLSEFTRYGGAVAGNTVGSRPDYAALGVEYRTLELEGRLREYLVYESPSARAAASRGESVPLVMALHGSGMTMYSMFDFSRWWEIADREGFLLVVPTGLNTENRTGWALADDSVDITFLQLVLDAVQAEHAVDDSRVYLGGQSMGSMMTQTVGRDPELSTRFAALGSTSGVGTSLNTAGQTLPYFLLFGEFDFWPYDPATPTVGNGLAYWIARNGALGSPTEPTSEKTVGRYDLAFWADPRGNDVVAYGVTRGRGHSIIPDEMNLLWDWYAQWRQDPDGTSVPVLPEVAEVYSLPFDATLVRYREGDDAYQVLSYADWAALGFPEPEPAPTQLLSFSWSPAIYAVSSFGGSSYWDALSYAQWSGAGFPTPGGDVAAARLADVFTYATSPDVYVAADPSVLHRLTLEDWLRMGAPTPAASPLGFHHLAWAPEGIAEVDTSAGSVAEPLSYEAWAARGFPTPRPAPSLPGDRVCFVPGTDRLAYDGATWSGTLSYEQWRSTGFLPPATC